MNTSAGALIAQFGLDTAPLEAGFRRANATGEREGRRFGDTMNKHGKFELKLEGENKVERKITGLVGDLVNAKSGVDAFAASLDRIGDSISLGMKGGIAIGAAATLISSFAAARKECNELSKAIDATLQDRQNPTLATFEELHSRLKAINEQGEKLSKMSLWQKFAAGGKQMGEMKDANEDARKQTMDDLVAKERFITQLKEDEVKFGERYAELKKIELDYERKIADVRKTGDPGLKRTKELRKQEALDKDVVNKKFDDKERADDDKAREAENAKLAAAGKEQEKVDAANARLADMKRDALRGQMSIVEQIRDIERERAEIARRIMNDGSEADVLLKQQLVTLESQAAALRKTAKSEGERQAKDKQHAREMADAESKRIAAETSRQQTRKTDRSRLTLGDLAEHGKGADARTAREVEKLEKKSRDRALRGDLSGADGLMSRADRLRNSIASIKSTEKADTIEVKNFNAGAATFASFDLKVGAQKG